MRLQVLFYLAALVLGLSVLGAKDTIAQSVQYDITMYEGFPHEAYPEQDRKDLKPEKALLRTRVEVGEKFHVEGQGVMFEGELLGVRNGNAEFRIDQSHRGSTSCNPIGGTVKLTEAALPRVCGFSSIILSYYFRVKSASVDERVGQQESEILRLIAKAEQNTYTVRHIDFMGNMKVRDNEMRLRINKFLREGDVFLRQNLYRGLRNLSKLSAIYAVSLENVQVSLDEKRTDIDITITVREGGSHRHSIPGKEQR